MTTKSKTKKAAAAKEQTVPVTPEERVLALMAELAEVSAEAAKRRDVIANTPIGQQLAEMEKAVEQLTQELRKACEFLKEGTGSLLQNPYGMVQYTRRNTRTYAPEAVRELAPELYYQVCSEKVDTKLLQTLVKSEIERRHLPADTMAKLDDHVLTETSVTWAFSCKLLGSSKKNEHA